MTTISWTATDIFGNVNVVAQLVTVVDTEKPVLTVPAGRDPAGRGTASPSIVITDAELGTRHRRPTTPASVTIVRTGVPAGNVFPVGTTTITYTATDAAGNVTTGTQTVTVTRSRCRSISVGATDASGNEYLRDPIVFTITRSGSTLGSITINLGWSGTAIFGTDYTVTATGGTLGRQRHDDHARRGRHERDDHGYPDRRHDRREHRDRHADAELGRPVYALGTPTIANGSIIDNDGSATVSIARPTTPAPRPEANPIVFTVTRGGNIWSNVVVNLGWTGTATLGTDYTVDRHRRDAVRQRT